MELSSRCPAALKTSSAAVPVASDNFGKLQDDQHPPSNVKRGEQLIANVYNALRSNQSLWEKSLLVILYNEHGGFYDHVEPPAAVPPDDSLKEFSFAQYGVRVPAILVSPWVNAGVADDEFDHTSLLKYVTDKWGLGPLGDRVVSAGSFAGYIADGIAAPRTDTPPSVTPPQVAADPAQTSLNAIKQYCGNEASGPAASV
jgi:phospholipase C